jgi:hypothetical protein
VDTFKAGLAEGLVWRPKGAVFAVVNGVLLMKKSPPNTNAQEKPAAYGESNAIFENIYCTWMNFG